MYNLVRWTPELDLTDFYATAETKGFVNNASQKMLVDSLAKEEKWCVWILYYGNQAVGSVGAHSFPEMGEDAFRIAARTCVFTDELPGAYGRALRTISVITEHQNPTAQFLIPACIEWAPSQSKLYITSNNNSVGTQRRVHRIFGPALEKLGQMKRITEMEYRGSTQTIWQLYPDMFLNALKCFPRWC